jgi:hemerythrin superfamily protein
MTIASVGDQRGRFTPSTFFWVSEPGTHVAPPTAKSFIERQGTTVRKKTKRSTTNTKRARRKTGNRIVRKTMKSPDAVKLLKKDHQTVKALFSEIEELSPRASAKKMQLFEQLKTELSIHARIEEEIFYPAVHSLRAKEAKERVFEAYEEHAVVKLLLAQCEESIGDERTFDAKMKVLRDIVLHHAKEEEKEIFPQAQRNLPSEKLDDLGAALEARKVALEKGDLADEPEIDRDEMLSMAV